MPSTLVYLDERPSRIALIAASLMLSGVSKSGSPAPRPMTSRPANLSARALSVTAMVADGLMRCSESARKPKTTSLWHDPEKLLLPVEQVTAIGPRIACPDDERAFPNVLTLERQALIIRCHARRGVAAHDRWLAAGRLSAQYAVGWYAPIC